MWQERAKELAAHEEQLEEWKKRFKAEALRQIGERERALADWQAQLDAKRADLEDLKKNMEARPHSSQQPLKLQHRTIRHPESFSSKWTH